MGDRLSYRPAEVRGLIGLGKTKLGQLLATGEIESFVVGRARLVPRASIERWVRRRTQGGSSAAPGTVPPDDSTQES